GRHADAFRSRPGSKRRRPSAERGRLPGSGPEEVTAVHASPARPRRGSSLLAPFVGSPYHVIRSAPNAIRDRETNTHENPGWLGKYGRRDRKSTRLNSSH